MAETELLHEAREVLAAINALIKERPQMAGKLLGSTTLGNHRVHLMAAIERAAHGVTGRCPWCSYERGPKLYARANASHAAVCNHCGAHGPYADSEEQADAAWNASGVPGMVTTPSAHVAESLRIAGVAPTATDLRELVLANGRACIEWAQAGPEDVQQKFDAMQEARENLFRALGVAGTLKENDRG